MLIPRYEDSQVKMTPVAVPQAQAAPAGSFGEGIAKGLGDVANAGVAYVTHENLLAKQEKEKQDKAVADKAETALIGQFDKNILEALQVTGRAVTPDHDEDGQPQPGAPDLVTQYSADFKEQRAEIEKNLTEDQKKLFAHTADRHEIGLLKKLMEHQVVQTEAWQTEQHAGLAATISKSLEAVTAPDLPVEDLNRLYDQTQLIFGKISEERGIKEYDRIVETIEKNRVENAIKRDDAATARSIYDSAVKNERIDSTGNVGSDLVHRLNSAEATEKGVSYIDSIWKKPENNAPIPNPEELYSGIKEAEKSTALTKAAAHIAKVELFDRITRHNQQSATKLHILKSDVWQKIDDKEYNLKQALSAVDTAAMPGDERVQMKKQIENYFKPPKDPYALMEQRLSQDSALADMMDKINKGELRVEDLKDAQGYTSTLGRENVNKLYKYGQGYEKALASPQLTPEQFSVAVADLRSAGIELPPEKIDGKVNPRFLAMRGYVIDTLVNEQVKKGTVLNSTEANKRIKELVSQELPVRMQGGWFTKPSTVYIEKKKPWEVQNPTAVDTASILRERLKREPTAAEIQQGQAEYLKPSASRKALLTGSQFGGTD